MPLTVTVLTPTWNAATWAREAAASVAAQTGAAIEHLVLDAGSTDQTVREIRAGNPAATIVVENVRDGIYAALNRGLSRATGDVIGWLNADDYWRPDAISRAVAVLEADPAAALAFGDLEILDHTGTPRVIRHPADVLARCASGDLVDGFVTPLCCFWRREALRDLGPYDPGLRIVADRDLWMRLASLRPLPKSVRIDGIVGTFREHEGSLSSGSRGTYRVLQDHARLWHRWADAPEATAAMRIRARALWQTTLLDLATREAKSLQLVRATRSLSTLAGSGRGWWKPFANVRANLARRREGRKS